MIRIPSLLLFLLIIAATSKAQPNQTAPTPNDLLWIKDNITLSVAGIGFSIPQPPMTNALDLDFKASYGLQGRLTHTLNFGRRFGMEIAINAGWHRYRFLVVSEPGLNTPAAGWLEKIDIATFELPLRAFCRFPLRDRHFLGGFAGLKLARYPARYDQIFYSSGIPDEPTLRVEFGLSLDYGFYLPFTFGLQHHFLLTNDDLLRLSLEFNWNGDVSPVLEGNYITAISSRPSVRTHFSHQGNYLALEIGYTFSRIREAQRDLRRLNLIPKPKRAALTGSPL